MSLEMAHKVIVPQKKNYVPQFLKQRDINSYYIITFAPCQQKSCAFGTGRYLFKGIGTGTVRYL
jgi:hypothetical protein